MKQFFYILLIPFFLFQFNSTKLVGKYKLQYNNSSLPKYTVTFNDSTYLKKSTSFLHIINGKIYYSKDIVTMRDENSNLIIDFFLKIFKMIRYNLVLKTQMEKEII